MQGHWRELAEFGDCEPSELAFRAIVALLDTWPGDDQAAAIKYADKLLGKWPDAVRVAPWSWCKAASKGVVLPTWRLVRALHLPADHLTKEEVDIARVAHHAGFKHISILNLPFWSGVAGLSLLYHRPEAFPYLKSLQVRDEVRRRHVASLGDSPLWRRLESFQIEGLSESLFHQADASRIVPKTPAPRLRHLTLRAPDLASAWKAGRLPKLRSASVFIRSPDEARSLAGRAELARLSSLSIAFRCGFCGSSPFEPFIGNVIEADEEAANAFFGKARLSRLKELAIVGYSMGHWGREGPGPAGLKSLIASGILRRLTRLRLELLPLGDMGVAAIAPELGRKLESLELVDVYCKGDGAAALVESPGLASLRHLDLSKNRIDSRQFERLAGLHLPRLQTLDLSGQTGGPYYSALGQQPLLDAGAVAWADSATAAGLERLRLANCHLGDDALKAVFASRRLRKLRHLDLSHNSFSAAAISVAAGSALWKTLAELNLLHCGLDDKAIHALTRVAKAPALRSLELGYNSIGPAGAASLAKWPVLERVWHLGLHDNIIGDPGLIALARSRRLGRLLELDLEHDCWNSGRFDFGDEAAEALAASRALPRLDGVFTGCVDEYHGTGYSPGFSKRGVDLVRNAPQMRPAFRAAAGDFSGVSDYLEFPPFNENARLTKSDFRSRTRELNVKEAEPLPRHLQQKPSRFKAKKVRPPQIPPAPEEVAAESGDIIEGIESRDPTPRIDHRFEFDLSLQDRQRPLPEQSGKLLSDTLGSIFKACGLGYFEVSGGTSTTGDDGRQIQINQNFSLGIKGDPAFAARLIREALWCIGAPADTEIKGLPLKLNKAPKTPAARFVQFATPEIARWNSDFGSGHRIDRVPFSKEQRDNVRAILSEAGAGGIGQGRVEVSTRDGGRAVFFTKYLDDSAEFDTLNVLVDELTPQLSALIHRIMTDGGFLLWPMTLAATPEAASKMDCDWPKVQVITSADALLQVLARGPYHWWNHRIERRG